ncbi:hypothetical protein BN2537_7827 [Streptomyces venezuelae]|nr:hypothetical protein BN2537_7827 [Streptomyces venezuelae]
MLVGAAVALAGGDRRELGGVRAVRPRGDGAENPAHGGRLRNPKSRFRVTVRLTLVAPNDLNLPSF